MAEPLPHAPATARNREPILARAAREAASLPRVNSTIAVPVVRNCSGACA